MSTYADFIGVNTHLDFSWTAYGNTKLVIDCLNYLGVKHVRDSANSPNSARLWQQVAHDAGVKFNAYIGQGSQQVAKDGLARLQLLMPALESIEGVNEADGAYSIQQGNSLAFAADFQKQVYALGKKLGLPVINISFGAGWDKQTGNYGTVGDLTAYCDYANAHTYPGASNVAKTIEFANGLTQLAAKRPVITTEIGWYSAIGPAGVTEELQAKEQVTAIKECQRTGNVRAYIYELLDQDSGNADPEKNFGLFRSDGTPKPAAVAIRDLMKQALPGVVPTPAPKPAPVPAVAPAPAPAPKPGPAPAIGSPVINADGSITDAWAAKNPGVLRLNLTASGTLKQLNAIIAKCPGQVSVEVYNQAGKSASRVVVKG